MTLTVIEKAVLDWFQNDIDDLSLKTQIREAKAGKRELSPIGFFTDLVVSKELDPNGVTISYTGCALFAKELEIYADCILHTKSGVLDYLEVYSIGDGKPQDISDFEVRAIKENHVEIELG